MEHSLYLIRTIRDTEHLSAMRQEAPLPETLKEET